MRRALVGASLALSACVPDFDRYSFVSIVDGAPSGFDLGTTDAGDGCASGAFTVPSCDGAPHLLFTHSPTGYVTIERFGAKDAACASVTLPGVTGTASAVAELSSSLAVAVGPQVAIASDGQIRCITRAGHEPADLFVHDDAFAIAWRPTGGSAIDAIEIDGKSDLAMPSTSLLRVTQSAFDSYELVGSTGLPDTTASFTYDPDELTNATQPYAFGAGVTLGAVAGGGGSRVAWVSASDPRVVYHVDAHVASGAVPSLTCSAPIARAIPSLDSGITYRVLGSDGRARTLGSSSCTEDAIDALAPYDAIGLGVVP